MGVDNFCAVANNFGDIPFLIKGRAIKSMNQNFNKERARLLSEVTKGSDSTHSVKKNETTPYTQPETGDTPAGFLLQNSVVSCPVCKAAAGGSYRCRT